MKGYAISIGGGTFVCVENMGNRIGNRKQCMQRYGQNIQSPMTSTTTKIQNTKITNKQNYKIAVSCVTPTLDSQIDPRFGRAEHFLIIDPITMEFEHIDNSQIRNTGSGAGIQTAGLIAQTNANILLTGLVGPKAASALASANIVAIEGFEGFTVSEAIEKFKNENDFDSEK